MKDVINAKKNSSISDIIETTSKQIIELACANSVFGEAVNKDGITIIPVSKISAGFAGGGIDIQKTKKSQTPAGAGAKVEVTPTHFLQISDGKVSLISPSTQTAKTDIAEFAIKAVKNIIKKK